MTIKRLLGGLCLLVGIAIATSQTANAWQIQNNYQDEVSMYCINCGWFGEFDQQYVPLKDIVYCDGAEEGCRGPAEDGYAAHIIMYSSTIVGDYSGYMAIIDYINPQGKIVFNSTSYAVYYNESDTIPSKPHQPYPRANCNSFGRGIC